MKSISVGALVTIAAVLGASNVAAAGGSNGCYSSISTLTLNGTDIYNSMGYCQKRCAPLGFAVMATKDMSCYCGQKLPPSSSAVDDSECTTQCPGYPTDFCGGNGVYNVYLTGASVNINNGVNNGGASNSASSTSTSSPAKETGSPTAAATASVVTVGGQTVVVTASSSSTNTAPAQSSSSGPSKAGIAAGVVIGLAAIAAAVGGGYFFIRNRRRREVEEEYRRNAAVSSFIGSSKPPGSSGGHSSFNDMRLDPAAMAQRRMSDGSIADNQDYSRRILKVTNA